VHFLENDAFYDRPGLYTDPNDDSDYPDNSSRFIFLSRGCLEACKALGLQPEVFHCHDWPAGLLPVYLTHLYRRDFPTSASIFTLHNVAYKGLFSHEDMRLTGLPWELFNWKMLEYYGKLSFLKAGLVGADLLTTVSRSYASELQTEQFGMGMEGVLRSRAEDLCGIVNGADYRVWNPWLDKCTVRRYSAKNLSGKKECKRALQQEFNLTPQSRAPLIGMVGRLVKQKGFDLVAEALPKLMEKDFQFVVLGTGQPEYHELLAEIASRFPGRIGVKLGFDEALAHRIEAGSDMFLMPSRFEPCGLNQLYSLKYGAVPIVSNTGGLADTVVDFNDETRTRRTATGFVFEHGGEVAMLDAIDRALRLYKVNPGAWRALQVRGMKQDWSWEHSAKQYVEVYKKALQKARLR
jgi:starch synthase